VLIEKKARRGTTLVAVKHKGRIALAADSLESWGYHPTNETNLKIIKLKACVYAGWTGDAAIGETVAQLLTEVMDIGAYATWIDACMGYFMLLRSWTEVADDPIHKGVAKSLLNKESDWAMGIIVAPEGIFKILSTGEFGRCDMTILGGGCGGDYAEGAASALIKTKPKWTAARIAREAVKIASKSTVFANDIVNVVTVRVK